MSEGLPEVTEPGQKRNLRLRRLCAPLVVIWTFIGSNKEQLTLIGAIVAAWWGWQEYQDKIVDDQVQRTLQYASRFSGGELSKYRNELDSHWLKNDANLNKAAKPEQFILTEVQKQKFEGHLRRLAEYYDEISICTNRSLCDRGISCEMFSVPALAHFRTHAPVFEFWNTQWGERQGCYTAEFLKQCGQHDQQDLKLAFPRCKLQ
jgi:hypothetical protein